MTEHLFPDDGVWQFLPGGAVTVTRHGCYPEVVRVKGELTREDVLREHPDDPDVRTIVSDWLEERGEGKRAALLRTSPVGLSLEQALLWINEGKVAE